MFEDQQEIQQKQTENFEADQNLIGFFNLLLQIDKRINPQNYKNNDRHNNTDN